MTSSIGWHFNAKNNNTPTIIMIRPISILDFKIENIYTNKILNVLGFNIMPEVEKAVCRHISCCFESNFRIERKFILI